MAEPDPFGTGGFTTSRVFAAARERVWREWTEPESFADWFGDDGYELITVQLTDLGDGRTEMHFEQRGQQRPDEHERAEQGWGTFFARIDERLATAP
jgi:uncharacterized protein YndB with AHSA1/START domain